MTNKISGFTTDMQDLQDWTCNVHAEVAKIVESQTLIFDKFEGKPEPNPVESVKMMRGNDEKMSKELDYSHASNHGIPWKIFSRFEEPQLKCTQ